jgi:hypothetical protein
MESSLLDDMRGYEKVASSVWTEELRSKRLAKVAMVARAAAVSRLSKKHRMPGFGEKLRKPGRLFKIREAYIGRRAWFARKASPARSVFGGCVRAWYLASGGNI